MVRMARARPTLIAAAALLGLSPALAGAGPRPGGSQGPDVVVEFEQGADGVRVVVGGSAQAVASLAGPPGAVRWVPGPGGQRGAAQFPGAGRGGGAVVVRTTGGTDVLSPGLDAFTIAADVRRDAGLDVDGDNVLQRGLWNDPGQYKLQLDGGYASCVVAGTRGRVVTKIESEVVPGVWYRLVCRRDGDTVRLALRRLDVDASWHAVARGPIGSVRAASPDSPLTIGAKVGESGELTAQPDQFNGAVGDVVVRVD